MSNAQSMSGQSLVARGPSTRTMKDVITMWAVFWQIIRTILQRLVLWTAWPALVSFLARDFGKRCCSQDGKPATRQQPHEKWIKLDSGLLTTRLTRETIEAPQACHQRLASAHSSQLTWTAHSHAN